MIPEGVFDTALILLDSCHGILCCGLYMYSIFLFDETIIYSSRYSLGLTLNDWGTRFKTSNVRGLVSLIKRVSSRPKLYGALRGEVEAAAVIAASKQADLLSASLFLATPKSAKGTRTPDLTLTAHCLLGLCELLS